MIVVFLWAELRERKKHFNLSTLYVQWQDELCLQILQNGNTKYKLFSYFLFEFLCKIKFLVVLCCKKIIFIEYVDIIRNFVCAHAVF